MTSYNLYIDICNDSFYYIVGKNNKEKIMIISMGKKIMEQVCYENGKIVDPIVFKKIIFELLNENKIKKCNLYIIINDRNIINKVINIPLSDEKDVKNHLDFEAAQYLPINVNNYIIDFKIIDKSIEGNSSKVLVTAALKENIMSLINTFEKTSIELKVIDSYANNICRIFSGKEENLGIIDINCTEINFTILEKRVFYLNSSIDHNLNDILTQIAQDFNSDINEVKEKILHKNYDYSSINLNESNVQEDFKPYFSSLVNDLYRYIDFYNSRHFGQTLDKIYIIGEGSLIKGLKSYISEMFNTKVSIGAEVLAYYKNEELLKNNKEISFYGLISMASRGE